MRLEAPNTWWIGNFTGVHSPQVQGIPVVAGVTAPRLAIGVSGASAYAVGEHGWIPALAGMMVVASTVAMSMASFLPSGEWRQ